MNDIFDTPSVARVPISEAHFLDWLEPHMEQRMVPPEGDKPKPRLTVVGGTDVSKMSTADLLAMRETLVKYDPSQPRADDGRWTTGSGGSSEGRSWAGSRDVREAVKPGGRWVGNEYVGGTYTPERSALHDHIVANILAEGRPVAKPVVTMLGGGPASGKSSIIRSGTVNFAPGTATVNPDDVKLALPEFKQMLAEGGAPAQHASTYVHEESSEVSKMALREAAAGKISVIYDATGDSSLASIRGKVDSFRAAGYAVNADYVTCGTDEAWNRAVARANDPNGDGRSVPEDYLRETHAALSATVPQGIEERVWDNFRLWDTSGGSLSDPPVLVASYKDRGEVTIHDPARWDAFKAKAAA